MAKFTGRYTKMLLPRNCSQHYEFNHPGEVCTYQTSQMADKEVGRMMPEACAATRKHRAAEKTGKFGKQKNEENTTQKRIKKKPWRDTSGATGCVSNKSSSRTRTRTRILNTSLHRKHISRPQLRTHDTDTQHGTRFPGLSITFSQPPTYPFTEYLC